MTTVSALSRHVDSRVNICSQSKNVVHVHIELSVTKKTLYTFTLNGLLHNLRLLGLGTKYIKEKIIFALHSLSLDIVVPPPWETYNLE